MDIALGSRAFVVGPNASGKSNLLDALRFISEVARAGTGGIKAAIENRGGLSSIRCLQARDPSWIEIAVTLGSSDGRDRWLYRVRFNTVGREKLATVVEEEVAEAGVDGWTTVRTRKRGPLDEAQIFSQTLLEQVEQSSRFREVQQFLESCRYLHVVPQIVRDRDRARPHGDDPYGGDLLRRMKAMPKKTRGPRPRRISDALAIAVPQFNGLTLEDDGDGVPHLYASYSHWRKGASKQSERVFSDGTLRLIGLLWSMSERGGPLLLEEPELSLNDSVVSELPRMLSRMQRLSFRQVVVTTHSVALLDDEDVGLGEVYVIVVDKNGSSVRVASAERVLVAQVEHGFTVGQAVMPLLRPKNLEKIETTNVAA